MVAEAFHLMPTPYSNCSHYPLTVKEVSHRRGIGGLTRGDQMVREDKLQKKTDFKSHGNL